MILITMGTQNFQVDKLVKIIDDMIEDRIINEEVIFQVKKNSYVPKNFNIIESIPKKIMDKFFKNADVIITHAGTGSLIMCEKMNKKYIIYPRTANLKEHVDDHQMEIAEVFSREGNGVLIREKNRLEFELALKEVYSKSKRNRMNFNNEKILRDIEIYVNKENDLW